MSDSTAARLLAKLRSLDLEDDEAALLTSVFERAAEPEVAGFSGATLDPLGMKNLFPSRSRTFEFKGTDEELQAIIDWLGSLEAQK